jgi:hypothetical protein
MLGNAVNREASVGALMRAHKISRAEAEKEMEACDADLPNITRAGSRAMMPVAKSVLAAPKAEVGHTAKEATILTEAVLCEVVAKIAGLSTNIVRSPAAVDKMAELATAVAQLCNLILEIGILVGMGREDEIKFEEG